VASAIDGLIVGLYRIGWYSLGTPGCCLPDTTRERVSRPRARANQVAGESTNPVRHHPYPDHSRVHEPGTGPINRAWYDRGVSPLP
jgi:hypothetical protein